ncbi:hydantoinase/carbamoylase family amidase [Rhodoplanes serenus]|uniref:Hydantoinase/carbamoylase family amidase n=1 Tax=Rhodoplanes serenus TaxID=200615 RepID=A0A327KDF0_9BRAD|nr:Zn-dependent hydrolase [Rhodoplanes serenus]MTW16980.1 hydantoinase/carbamoylase family amidase [Rhodoplanes serenus]RAI36397.1 Zn-dependent hydrolase [Rhodoplanes serenus]
MSDAAVVRLPEPLRLRDIAADLFDALRERSFDGTGITRECYDEGENAAIALFRETAERHGLEVRFDAAANMIVSLPGDTGTKPGLLLASHADSVPQGGNFDGAAGIVAGLLTLIRLAADGTRPPCPVRVMVLRGEESAFYGRANIGSRILFGQIDPRDLAAKRRGSGRTLREALTATGIDADAVAAGRRMIDPATVKAYLELHIEQGPVMVARKFPTAVVTGIRGNLRHRAIVCRGEAGHSGTVPRWLRRDAVFAVSDLLVRLDEHWMRLLERGLDLVVTTGVIGTDPDQQAISRIPGEVTFSFEVRSQSYETLEAFYELFRSECRAVSDMRHVKFEFDDRVYTEPARMDEAIVRKLVALSERLGLPSETLASGAGHDAAVFSNGGIPSGMIFVRNANGSHNPAEAMDLDDFMRGVELMHAFAVDGP